MLVEHLRHVPILDGAGKVLGLLSIRALLEDTVNDLSRELSALEQYICKNNPGVKRSNLYAAARRSASALSGASVIHRIRMIPGERNDQ